MKKKWIILFIIIGLLFVLRLLAPGFLLKYANKKLAKIQGYKGVVKDVDLALYKGAYIIDSVYFTKEGADFPEPFMAAGKVIVMIDWNALLGHGKLVAFVTVENARLNFSVAKSGSGKKIKQTGKGVNWLEHFRKMSPLEFNRLEVRNSAIYFQDYTTKPEIRVYLNSIRISGSNLQNTKNVKQAFPGELHLTANSLGGGKLNLSVGVNMQKKPMDVNTNLEFEDMVLKEWNDLIQAKSGLDIEAGSFNCYSEIEVSDGKIDGYIKPVIDNLKIKAKKEHEGFFDKAWEAIAGGIASLLENHKEEQIASRIPVSGTIDDVDADVPAAILNTFKNAFTKAFSKELEHSVPSGKKKD